MSKIIEQYPTINLSVMSAKENVRVDYITTNKNIKVLNENKQQELLLSEEITEFPNKSKLKMKVFDVEDVENSLIHRINTENYLIKVMKLKK